MEYEMSHAAFFSNRRPDREGNEGVALLELALVTPLLILCVVGVVDFGLELREHTVVVEAARVGGRAASLVPAGSSPSTISDAAVRAAAAYLQSAGYPVADYRFEVAPRELTFSHSIVNTVRINIAREPSALRALIAGKRIESSVVSQFPLPRGNSAERIGTSGVSVHVS